MGYYDGLNSVELYQAGMKTKVSAQEDIEFLYRQGGLDDGEYHSLMDSLGVAPAARRHGAIAYGINSEGIPFYVRGTGHLYR